MSLPLVVFSAENDGPRGTGLDLALEIVSYLGSRGKDLLRTVTCTRKGLARPD